MKELGRLILVTPSTQEPLSLAETKLWLKIEDDDVADDPLVESLITTARERYETHGRCLLYQTFDDYLATYPCATAIELPKFPLVSVTSVTGFTETDLTDTGGTAMSSSEMYVDVASEPGRVVSVAGATWPVATRRVNPIIIRFTAGYSSETSGVPELAKTTLKKMVARAYEFRGDQSQAEIDALMDEVLGDELSLPEWG